MTFRIAAFMLTGLFVLTLGVSAPPALHAGIAIPRTNPSTFSNEQWAGVFAVAAELPLPQRIALWADLVGVDAEYVADPLGEGPGKMPDADPLCDFAHVDCLTYVEQVFALALSGARPQFQQTLRQIRYKDGQIDYRWRNHYTVSDWLPANRWLLYDVTEEVGSGLTQTMTKTISRGQFFAKKGLAQYKDIPDEESSTSYIPREDVAQVTCKLKTGDMVIFVIDTPAIIAGHVGLIHVEKGIVCVQHASLTAKTVVKVPLTEYLRKAPHRFVGCKFVRLNAQITVPSPPAP